LSGGHVVGNFPPHEAFAIGGTNSVRGYEEGAVASGRSYAVGSGEISFPMVSGTSFFLLLIFFFFRRGGRECSFKHLVICILLFQVESIKGIVDMEV